MAFKTQSIFTGTFNNESVDIVESMGLTLISINPISGTTNLIGQSSIPGLSSSSVTLVVGQPVLISADSGYTLDDIRIDASGGGVFEILGK
jgi:hypothetical protein